MSILFSIASNLPDSIKIILILGFFAIVYASPLVYKILSGEKFVWFRDPNLKRPDKKQWNELRTRADRVIEGKEKIDGKELFQLIRKMQIEINYYKRKRGTIEYEKDIERIKRLSQKLQAMDLRTEPFDSLIDNLTKDGLVEQAKKLHTIVHSPSNKSLRQLKKEFLEELSIIRDENWSILDQKTKEEWKQSVKLLKYNPFRSLYVFAALFAIGIGLRFYHSIIENNGYEFYRKYPVWIVIFAIIIGVPVLILIIKFLSYKYSKYENPYNQNPI